jgi:hypothetical protein
VGFVRRKGGRIVGVQLDADDVDPVEVGAWLELEGSMGVDVSSAPYGLSAKLDRARSSSAGGDAKATITREALADRNDRIEAKYLKAFEAKTRPTWSGLTDLIGERFGLSGKQIRRVLRPRNVPRPPR